MAVGVVMRLAGVTQDQYEGVMAPGALDLRSPGNPDARDQWPEGIIAHYAGATEDGWCVVDVWETREHFERFVAEQLGPGMASAGVPQPELTFFDLYNSHS